MSMGMVSQIAGDAGAVATGAGFYEQFGVAGTIVQFLTGALLLLGVGTVAIKSLSAGGAGGYGSTMGGMKSLKLFVAFGLVANIPTAFMVIEKVSDTMSMAAGDVGSESADVGGITKETAAPTTATPTTAAPTTAKQATLPLAPPSPETPKDMTKNILIVAGIAGMIAVFTLIMWGGTAYRKRRHRRRDADAENLRVRQGHLKTWGATDDLLSDLLAQYTHAATDWDMVFGCPMLQDPSVPETYRMLGAMRDATNVDPTMPSGLDAQSVLADFPYPKLVAKFQQTWEIALVHAKRVGQSKLTAVERELIREIRLLLAIAEDAGAAPTERQLAYQKVQQHVTTLTKKYGMAIPKTVVLAIDDHARKELTAGEPSLVSASV